MPFAGLAELSVCPSSGFWLFGLRLLSGDVMDVRRGHGFISTVRLVCQAYPDHHGEVRDEEKRRDGSNYLEAAVLPARDLTVLTDG